MPEPSLFDLSRNGGCGCKASPAQLRKLLGGVTAAPDPGHAKLLVGHASADDCAAWLLDDGQVLVSTTDFFMPVVNDPDAFGRIAAANALSDIFAMGARPIFALAILGMPMARMSAATISRIMGGGRQMCAAAGICIGGGHTIDCAEPVFGLAVNGLCARKQLCRNDTAEPGDALVLSKPLGVGILSNALRKGKLAAADYELLVAHTTQLNIAGAWLAERGLATAMTDVTGFGLLGHALEMARGAQLRVRLRWPHIPLLAPARQLAEQGCVTGASQRNWDSYGNQVRFAPPRQQLLADLLTDPQTSGGLLIACSAANADQVIKELGEQGFKDAACIGECVAGEPGVEVGAQ